MAIQILTNKKITKFDVEDPNFKPLPKPEPEVVNGNLKEETDIYGERVHTYQPDNGNLQMSEFMTGVLNKLDGLKFGSSTSNFVIFLFVNICIAILSWSLFYL